MCYIQYVLFILYICSREAFIVDTQFQTGDVEAAEGLRGSAASPC